VAADADLDAGGADEHAVSRAARPRTVIAVAANPRIPAATGSLGVFIVSVLRGSPNRPGGSVNRQAGELRLT
jgi:hypothetical protein